MILRSFVAMETVVLLLGYAVLSKTSRKVGLLPSRRMPCALVYVGLAAPYPLSGGPSRA